MASPSTGGAAPIVGSSSPQSRIRRPKTREKVPTSEYPNLRDHGLSVEGPLLHLVGKLQARYGYGRVVLSEAGARKMLCEDIGHMPGQDTVRKALRRLAGRGTIVQEPLTKGDVLPDGQIVQHGARRLYLPQARRLHRSAYRGERVSPHSFAEARALVTKRLPSAAPPPPSRRRYTREEIEAILAATPRTTPEPKAPS